MYFFCAIWKFNGPFSTGNNVLQADKWRKGELWGITLIIGFHKIETDTSVVCVSARNGRCNYAHRIITLSNASTPNQLFILGVHEVSAPFSNSLNCWELWGSPSHPLFQKNSQVPDSVSGLCDSSSLQLSPNLILHASAWEQVSLLWGWAALLAELSGTHLSFVWVTFPTWLW